MYKKNKKLFLFAILLCMLNLLADYMELWADNAPARLLIRTISSYTGYSIRPFILLIFLRLTFPKRKLSPYITVAVLNLLLYVTSPFTHLGTYFTTDEFIHYHRGPLGISIYLSRTRRWIILPIRCLLIADAVYSDYIYLHPNYLTSLNKALVLVLFLY